ncbi:MAG: type II toxin-antitoxin system ParD family antitoxin [Bacteroidota bacterium]
MQKNTSVTLGSHFDRFIAEQVEKGRYGSASEAIRAGLRLLEKEEIKLEALRNALIEGEQSGRADYSLSNLIAGLDAE